MLALAAILATFAQHAIRWQTEPFAVPVGKGAVFVKGEGLYGVRHRRTDFGVKLVCMLSKDEGKTWADLGTIVEDPDPNADLGDGNLLRRRDGTLVCAFRQNHHQLPDYAIRLAQSADRGKTWRLHSTVFLSKPVGPGPSRGLWAPFVFETDSGELQCYYDDEKTPFDRGFPGHQWVQMRRYDEQAKLWSEPVTVARAHDPRHLSRDGMATVVSLGKGRLLCAFESVGVEPPHPNLVRFVTSEDGGRTWSWTKREREVLYQPAKKDFMALAPCLARIAPGLLACIFVTDEDRETPDRSGTPAPQLRMDAKMALSSDGGKTWSKQPVAVYTQSQRTYLPWLAPMDQGRFAASWTCFDKGLMMRVGRAVADPR